MKTDLVHLDMRICGHQRYCLCTLLERKVLSIFILLLIYYLTTIKLKVTVA
jgi:hypothetical protein